MTGHLRTILFTTTLLAGGSVAGVELALAGPNNPTPANIGAPAAFRAPLALPGAGLPRAMREIATSDRKKDSQKKQKKFATKKDKAKTGTGIAARAGALGSADRATGLQETPAAQSGNQLPIPDGLAEVIEASGGNPDELGTLRELAGIDIVQGNPNVLPDPLFGSEPSGGLQPPGDLGNGGKPIKQSPAHVPDGDGDAPGSPTGDHANQTGQAASESSYQHRSGDGPWLTTHEWTVKHIDGSTSAHQETVNEETGTRTQRDIRFYLDGRTETRTTVIDAKGQTLSVVTGPYIPAGDKPDPEESDPKKEGPPKEDSQPNDAGQVIGSVPASS
jgi:hypothetical protein